MRFLLPLLLVATASAKVVRYDFPEEMPRSTVYQATVDGAEVPALQNKRGAFLNFGMTDPVEIVITLKEKPGAVAIRPLTAGIEPPSKARRFVSTLQNRETSAL